VRVPMSAVQLIGAQLVPACVTTQRSSQYHLAVTVAYSSAIANRSPVCHESMDDVLPIAPLHITIIDFSNVSAT